MQYCSDSSVGKESACNVGDLGSIPGLERFLGERKGYSLQYSGLKNSIDKCLGLVHWEDPEESGGEGGGRGDWAGEQEHM